MLTYIVKTTDGHIEGFTQGESHEEAFFNFRNGSLFHESGEEPLKFEELPYDEYQRLWTLAEVAQDYDMLEALDGLFPAYD